LLLLRFLSPLLGASSAAGADWAEAAKAAAPAPGRLPAAAAVRAWRPPRNAQAQRASMTGAGSPPKRSRHSSGPSLVSVIGTAFRCCKDSDEGYRTVRGYMTQCKRLCACAGRQRAGSAGPAARARQSSVQGQPVFEPRPSLSLACKARLTACSQQFTSHGPEGASWLKPLAATDTAGAAAAIEGPAIDIACAAVRWRAGASNPAATRHCAATLSVTATMCCFATLLSLQEDFDRAAEDAKTVCYASLHAPLLLA
jgi:hypothetical protein